MKYVIWKLKDLMAKGIVFDETDIPLKNDSDIYIYEDNLAYAEVVFDDGYSDLIMIGFANYYEFVDANHKEMTDDDGEI